MIKDFFDILSMISYIIRIYQNIIEINYHTNIKEVEKDVIHEVLEDSRGISEAKGITDYSNNL